MSKWAWTDPRAIYGSPTYGKGHTYKVVRQNNNVFDLFKPKYAVVKVSKFSVGSDWKPIQEPIYTGLTKETAEGYVKLLEEDMED